MAAKKTFEENMARLEQIVTLLEKGDAQLTDSLALFEAGGSVPQGTGQRGAEGGQADEGP